ncbi:adenylyl-sulfate kinase [Vreelandella gomseomensis]|uniref:Adenylyl-sulfate kinase n=1 Tax=Vreelandella gomseomensis TaxID=370766 RepID=A0ABU1GFF1_9GAMM|nr:adenylyl-sulfate kinase [Halomonas gomseomensis]MDR5876197.1 adenylyl-sulfate kinase [Halomonas gomseomensis]
MRLSARCLYMTYALFWDADEIENYLVAQQNDKPLQLIVDGGQGAGKSTLMNRLLSESSLQALADERPLASMPAAMLVVDVQQGVTAVTRRHCVLMSLMGLRHIAVAVNKMDAVAYSQARFESIVAELQIFVSSLPLPDITFIPVSSLYGDNMFAPSDNTPWYAGTSILGFMETLTVDSERLLCQPFRLSVEKVHQDASGLQAAEGSVASGAIYPGDDIRVQPSGRIDKVSQVVVADEGRVDKAAAGQLVTLLLDGDLAIACGDIISSADQPAQTADQFEAGLIWNSNEPLLPGRPYEIRLGSQSAVATVTSIKYQINTDTLEHVAARQLPGGEIGVCNLSLSHEVAFDPFHESPQTGSFVLLDRITGHIVGTGMLNFALRRSQNIHRQHVDIDKQARALAKNQKPAVLWFTGLSGAGKSTIANLVEKKLFAHGQHTYLLDGDNVRHGLNRDLGFTDADRVENIRRVAEVARLMLDAGLIVMSAFISPFRSERQLARDLFVDGEFIEVFVDTPLEVAEKRDPKGLYKKARRGDLKNFTGIDSAYEAPQAPELTLDTAAITPEEAAERVIQLLIERRVVKCPGAR